MYNNDLLCAANSQSRPLRDSKILLGPAGNSSAVRGSAVIGQTTITKPPDHDSTDTEDSDDSSDEKEKQVAFSLSLSLSLSLLLWRMIFMSFVHY
jgi:hypothetical protein